MSPADSATVPGGGFLRPLYCFWRLPLLLLHVLLGVGIAMVLVMSRRNRQRPARPGAEPFTHHMIRWWSGRLARIFGLRVVCKGQMQPDPVMFVANHTSWLDIGLLHSQRAACFVAKGEITRWPLVGWMAASAGTIFHWRGSNHSLSVVMHTMTQRLESGCSVAVFPEGGTGHRGVLKVFHARIFQVALDAGVTVQPVALYFSRHGHRLVDAGFREHESFMQNLFRLLGSAPMDACIHFLEPLPKSVSRRRHMAEMAREQILLALTGSDP